MTFKRISNFAACSAAATLAGVAGAEVTGTGGAATLIPAPADSTPHVLQSNTLMRVWEEQQDHTTASLLPIDIDGTPGLYDAPTTPPMTGGSLPAGSYVDSHMIHVDVISGGAWFNGWVEFKDEIIAVMVLCDPLDSSDSELGAAATIYPNCPSTFDRRTCDWDPGFTERITISPDGKRIDLTLYSSNNIDQIRVVTRADASGGGGSGDCVEFESLPPGGTWSCCGSMFNDSGIDFTTGSYTWPDGTEFFGGHAYTTAGCCDTGRALGLNNVNVDVNVTQFFGSDGVHVIEFCYEYCGGNVNLTVNGHREYTFSGFHTMPNNLFHAVGVDLQLGAPSFDGSCWTGVVKLVAIDPEDCITQLAIGGQELCIDHICAEEPCEGGGGGGGDCVTFDVPPPGAPWPCCGTTFIYDGIAFTTRTFRWFDGTPTMGGFASPTSDCCSEPPSPGLNLNNVQVEPNLSDFYGTDGVQMITFCYRDCGGNVNLRVNGVWAFAFNRLEDIPSGFFSGVGVKLINPPATPVGGCLEGMIALQVEPGACITQFSVGGQEFCIDDLCVEGPCDAAPDCPEDLDNDGTVGVPDLLILLGNWGACPPPCPPTCVGDIDTDCNVGTTDLLAMLAAWGDCD